MAAVRAKLFSHGGSQAVRLPKAFRFEGSEVVIRKEGDRVILEPATTDWKSLWDRIDSMMEEPFPEREPQPEFRDVDFDR